ncbi:MAG: hypothetical protein ACXWVQ_01285 [Methyloceanibacter sp.]
MVSPMREKRAWPPREKDADAEAVAAFEKTVAVVKETVVRSGEVLVSAKEDLNDHQRWLKVQTAQVEADRERHDRWLQRQRDRQEAHERREQKRTRRRQMRLAAMQAVTGAIAAAVFAVRSAIWSVIARTIAGLNYIDASAARGLRFVGGKLRDFALYVAEAIWRAIALAGTTARSLALSVWAVLTASLAALGRVCVTALASLGGLVRTGASRVSAKLHEVTPSAGHFLSVSFGGIAARARDASRSLASWLGARLAWLGAKAGVLMHRIVEGVAPTLSAVGAKAHNVAPALFETVGKASHAAGAYAKEGALRAQRFLPAKASPIEAENTVSLPRRIGGFELSQMLIIAGALLLVCGGLMLGSGLLMRAGAGSSSSSLATASDSEPIAWLFEHKTLPIDERSVFAYAATPEGVRIKGFAIGGVNLSEQPVGALGAILKPDLQAKDLKLALSVEMPGEQAGGAEPAGAAAAVPEGTIPSQAPFRLVFLFPSAANGGMTPHDVLAAYGGLMLKVHYEVDGKQRSFIQYLPPALLEEQLAEIAAEAKGS